MCALLSNKERQFLSPAACFESGFDLLAAMFPPLPSHILRKARLDALTVSWAQTDYFCVFLPTKHENQALPITDDTWGERCCHQIQSSCHRVKQIKYRKRKENKIYSSGTRKLFVLLHFSSQLQFQYVSSQSAFVLLIGGWLFQSSVFPWFHWYWSVLVKTQTFWWETTNKFSLSLGVWAHFLVCQIFEKTSDPLFLHWPAAFEHSVGKLTEIVENIHSVLVCFSAYFSLKNAFES